MKYKAKVSDGTVEAVFYRSTLGGIFTQISYLVESGFLDPHFTCEVEWC